MNVTNNNGDKMQVGDLVKHKDGIKNIGLIVDYLSDHGLYKVRWLVSCIHYYENSTGLCPAKNLEAICK
jgi:hypothetical protein